MKRVITSVLTLAILATPASALAQPIVSSSDLADLLNPKPDTAIVVAPKAAPKPVEQPKPVPVVYTVIEGDNLTKIGTTYNVEWQRLWAKNTQLTNPDLIHAGDQITIPLPDEALARDIPTAVSLPAITPGVVTRPAAYDSSNTYDWHSCTWWVKYNRPNIPNSWGNATDWLYNAQAQGYATGSEPQAGAVGWTYGHVIYVISVSGSTITIGDGNYDYNGSYRVRQANATDFTYIY